MRIMPEESKLGKRQQKIGRSARAREARSSVIAFLLESVRNNARFAGGAIGLYILGEIMNAQAFLLSGVLAACLAYVGWMLWRLKTRKATE